MVVPIVCIRVMVLAPVSGELSSEVISICVPASNSIVLPSKKVISAPESSPVFMVSPTSKDISTVASVQSSAPAFITNTSPSVIKSIVSVQEVEGAPLQPTKVEVTRIVRASIDSNFLRMVGLL